MMIRDQDHAMDSISGTLNTIAQQASLMGQEIGEHNE
jgi:syntaxin 6